MSGNYDPSIRPVSNAQTGIDNRTSFTTNNGRTQFINTVWNDTSYIKDDKNAGVEFKVNEGMTLQLNRRYNNGSDATYANMDKKHTGISFDLLDKFIEAAGKGILEDVDHQGYTDENKRNFGKAFDELRQKKLDEAKLDPYKHEYTKMKNGTEFTFSAEEIEMLYKAAGFDIPKKEESAPAAKKEGTEPDVPAQPSQPAQPITTTPEAKQPADDNSSNLRIGTKGQFNEDNMKAVLETIAQQLGIENADDLDIPFGGKRIVDGEGNITEEIRFTYNGKKYVVKKGNLKDIKVAEEEAGYSVQSEVGHPRVTIDGVEYKQRYNKRTGELERKKAKGIHRWHTVTNASAAGKPQEVQGVESALSSEPAEKTPEQIRQEGISAAIERFENGEAVTTQKGDYYTVIDRKGKKPQAKYFWQHDAHMVKLADGRYAFKSNNDQNPEYYTVEYQKLSRGGYTIATGSIIKDAVEAE